MSQRAAVHQITLWGHWHHLQSDVWSNPWEHLRVFCSLPNAKRITRQRFWLFEALLLQSCCSGHTSCSSWILHVRHRSINAPNAPPPNIRVTFKGLLNPGNLRMWDEACFWQRSNIAIMSYYEQNSCFRLTLAHLSPLHYLFLCFEWHVQSCFSFSYLCWFIMLIWPREAS